MTAVKWTETRLIQAGYRELRFGDHTTLVQVSRTKRPGGDWYWLAQHSGRELSGQSERMPRAKTEAIAAARKLVDEWELAGGAA